MEVRLLKQILLFTIMIVIQKVEALKINKKCTCSNNIHFEIKPKRTGGLPVMRKEQPWNALLLRNGVAICGGTLITDRHVLTACHCVATCRNKMNSFEDLSVGLNVHNRISMEGAVVIKVSKVIPHPSFNWDYTQDTFDVTILKLHHTVKFSSYISTVCLPPPDLNLEERNGTTYALSTGWGYTSNSGTTAKYLRQGVLRILTRKECLTTSMAEEVINTHGGIICAHHPDTDICKGDSGGPLVMNGPKNIIMQIGIASRGRNCKGDSTPGIFTYVPHYLKWIHDKTSDGKYCKSPI